jgi:hypothetical protein
MLQPQLPLQNMLANSDANGPVPINKPAKWKSIATGTSNIIGSDAAAALSTCQTQYTRMPGNHHKACHATRTRHT